MDSQEPKRPGCEPPIHPHRSWSVNIRVCSSVELTDRHLAYIHLETHPVVPRIFLQEA